MLGTILLVLLLIFLLSGFHPSLGYSYGSGGIGIGTILVIVLVLVLLGKL